MADNRFNLEERLINFSVVMISHTENYPRSFTGNYLANQLAGSGTAPALNYGEAQSAELRNDFIYKMKICLKELRNKYLRKNCRPALLVWARGTYT